MLGGKVLSEIMNDFVKESIIPEEIINKYQGKIPNELIEVWKEKGSGTLLKGYLKIINPDVYDDLIQEVYLRSKDAIPLFITSMGDIIVWEKDRYLNLLNFRKNTVNVISAGFDFFLDDLEDESFLEEELDWQPYPGAIEKLGEPEFDECFGYVPLLGLGGPEEINNLEKVKFKEHIYLITQFMGPIE